MLISHEQSFRMLSVTCRCILYTLVSIVFMGCHFGTAEGGKNHSMLTPKKLTTPLALYTCHFYKLIRIVQLIKYVKFMNKKSYEIVRVN